MVTSSNIPDFKKPALNIDERFKSTPETHPLSYRLVTVYIQATQRNIHSTQITENERIQTIDLIYHLYYLLNAKGVTTEAAKQIGYILKTIKSDHLLEVLNTAGVSFDKIKNSLIGAIEQYGTSNDSVGDEPYNAHSEHPFISFNRDYIGHLIQETIALENLFSLPVRNTKQRVIIGHSISKIITDYGNMMALAHRTSIDRTTLYKWTNNATSYGLPSLLKKLTRQFKDYEIDTKTIPGKADIVKKVTKSYPEVDQITLTNTEKGEPMSSNTIESNLLVGALIENNKALLEDKAELKKENKYLIKKIDDLDTTIQTLTNKAEAPNLNLDHSRLQFIVNMEKKTFVTCTQLYADLYGANAFDMIKSYTWDDVVHKDDEWRYPLLSLLSEQQLEQSNTWKVKNFKENKVFYVKTITLPIDKQGILKKVDAIKATEEDWNVSNSFFERFQPKASN